MRLATWLSFAIVLLGAGAAVRAKHSPTSSGSPARTTARTWAATATRYADTPNLDRLAARGLHLSRTSWSNAPVCAPARTAIISGMYPTSTGAEHMRSLTPAARRHADVPAAPARGRLLLHQQRQGRLQPRQAGPGLGRVVGRGALEEPQAGPAVLRRLQLHESRTRARSAPGRTSWSTTRPRCACRPTTPTRRRSATTGPSTTTSIATMDAHRRPAARRSWRRRAGRGHHRLLLRRPRLRHAAQQALAVQLRPARAADRVHFPAKFKALAPADYRPGRQDGPAGQLRRLRADAAQPRGRAGRRTGCRATRSSGHHRCRRRERTCLRLPRPHGRALRPGAQRPRRALRLSSATTCRT